MPTGSKLTRDETNACLLLARVASACSGRALRGAESALRDSRDRYQRRKRRATSGSDQFSTGSARSRASFVTQSGTLCPVGRLLPPRSCPFGRQAQASGSPGSGEDGSPGSLGSCSLGATSRPRRERSQVDHRTRNRDVRRAGLRISGIRSHGGGGEDPDMSTLTLPDYAPVPRSAIGPALNEQGYYVDRIERNLYWITDGTYQSAFLTTSDGVVLLDAPPTIGHNIQRAVDEIAAANGVSNKVNYLIYSHHHADHVGAASLFDKNVTRIGHEETRNLLLRDDDPARPPNEETFGDRRTLEIGGERIDLAWHGANHSPDNIIIHLPDHDTMMLIDIVNPGWVPVYNSNLTEDIPGYIEAPANALAYSWTHFIGGHVGRLGTRADVELHQQYMADIVESSRKAIDAVDPRRYYAHYGVNKWAAAKGHLDETTRLAAEPVIEKYK